MKKIQRSDVRSEAKSCLPLSMLALVIIFSSVSNGLSQETVGSNFSKSTVTRFAQETLPISGTNSSQPLPKNQIVATILLPAGTYIAHSILSPDGKTLYVSNLVGGATQTITVIDTTTNTITSTIPVNRTLTPEYLAITPDGSTLYAASYPSAIDQDEVWAIGTATNTITATVNLQNPFGLAVSPDGSQVYVCTSISGTVAVIDTVTEEIANTIDIGGDTWCVAFTPDGTRAYVTNVDFVSVVDTATLRAVKKISIPGSGRPTPIGPFPPLMSPDGKRLYVFIERSIVVVSTETNAVIKKIVTPPDSGILLGSPALTPDGKFLYFPTTSEVLTLDTVSDKFVGQPVVGPGNNWRDVAITPSGNYAYIEGLYTANGADLFAIYVVDIGLN